VGKEFRANLLTNSFELQMGKEKLCWIKGLNAFYLNVPWAGIGKASNE
jgi:hypothetical protein